MSLNVEVPLQTRGIGRDSGNPYVLCLYFNREPTDDEMRRLHDEAIQLIESWKEQP